jgi:hypothetical protein
MLQNPLLLFQAVAFDEHNVKGSPLNEFKVNLIAEVIQVNQKKRGGLSDRGQARLDKIAHFFNLVAFLSLEARAHRSNVPIEWYYEGQTIRTNFVKVLFAHDQKITKKLGKTELFQSTLFRDLTELPV